MFFCSYFAPVKVLFSWSFDFLNICCEKTIYIFFWGVNFEFLKISDFCVGYFFEPFQCFFFGHLFFKSVLGLF